MRHLFLLSLVALLAGAAQSAPVPPPRSAPRPWFVGWGKPEDPVGDCRFDRAGGTLTITVPGAGHELHLAAGSLNAPSLCREIEGDFAFELRVSADFPESGDRMAGVVLRGGRGLVMAGLVARTEGGERRHYLYLRHTPTLNLRRIALGDPSARLRLQREGQRLVLSLAAGRGWRAELDDAGWALPRKVKLSVFAASWDEGRFVAAFDSLKFTQAPPRPSGVGPAPRGD
jgi:hypothetical protein